MMSLMNNARVGSITVLGAVAFAYFCMACMAQAIHAFRLALRCCLRRFGNDCFPEVSIQVVLQIIAQMEHRGGGTPSAEITCCGLVNMLQLLILT